MFFLAKFLMEALAYPINMCIQKSQGDVITDKDQKCQLGRRTWPFLDHMLRKGHIILKIANIEAVQEFRLPLSKIEVNAFLGLTGYYRWFLVASAP